MLPIAGSAHHQRAGLVAVIAVYLRPPVHNDEVTELDWAISGPVMWLCAVIASSHNRVEGCPIGTVVAHLKFQCRCKVSLSPAWLNPGDDLHERRGTDLTRVSNMGHFLVIFYQARRLHRTLQREHAEAIFSAQNQPLTSTEMVSLTPPLLSTRLRANEIYKTTHHVARQHNLYIGRFNPCLRHVTAIGDQYRCPIGENKGGVAAGEAGEVPNMRQ